MTPTGLLRVVSHLILKRRHLGEVGYRFYAGGNSKHNQIIELSGGRRRAKSRLTSSHGPAVGAREGN